MATPTFIDHHPTIDTYWRSIILQGLNVACYKFSLAKTLLEDKSKSHEIKIEELALPFALNVAEHLKKYDKQVTSASSKFLDACRSYNRKEITKDKLRDDSKSLGFVNVIGAFHIVAYQSVPTFFEDNRKKSGSIILTDNFYKLSQSEQGSSLKYEVESRWRLWETAISLGISTNLMEIKATDDGEELFINDKSNRRVDVTSARDALNGYQKGRCFYCRREITVIQGLPNSCDVDHFFPDKLKDLGFREIDQVWNLVLACQKCNRGESGKFHRIPDTKFLESLYARNHYYIESHHPLRETIIKQTGTNEGTRKAFLQGYFRKAVDAIPSKEKWKPKDLDGELL